MMNMQKVHEYKIDIADKMDDLKGRIDAIEMLTDMLAESCDSMVRVDMLKCIIDDVIVGTRACVNSARLLGAGLQDTGPETD